MPDSPRAESGGDWADDVRARLAALRLGPVREAEIVDELSQHLDLRYDELRQGGADDGEARRLALAELLEPEALARQMRALRQARILPPVVPGARRASLFTETWQDVRYASRMLRKQPGFAASAVLTLALGIGANTTIFSLVDATLLRRLPVPDREGLVYVHRGNVGGVFPYPLYAALRDTNQVFTGLAAWGGIEASLTAGGETDLVSGFIVTGNFFDVLGIAADRGRLLSPADDLRPGGHPVAVISHNFWRTRFASDPNVVGQDIRLNGHLFTIVGVTPAGFPGPVVGTGRDLYVPMMMQAIMRPPRASYSGEMDPDLLKHPTNSWLSGVGRLKPGIAPEQARAELSTLATNHVRTADPSRSAMEVPVIPIDEGNPTQRRRLRSVAFLLGGVVCAVLLIACANIANLLLARSASRRRELAVRLAVGASRGRLVRQLLTESVVLSTIGGLAGVGVAWMAIQALQAAPPPAGALPLPLDFSIDRRVLLFSLGLSILTGVVFGIAPALKASRPGLVPALKDGSWIGERGKRLNLQKTLVVAEVALSMLLLIPAGLFVRSLQAAQAIDPGLDADKLISAPLNINLLRYTSDKGRTFYREIVDRVQRIPGVESASVARIPVMGRTGRVVGIMVEGRDGYLDEFIRGEGGGVTANDRFRINVNVVGRRFFDTLGIPLVMGRDFEARDDERGVPVIIINEAAARMHFGGESPLGARVSFRGTQGPWREIVGVVRDSKYAGMAEGRLPVAYMPLSQNHETGMTLYVRASVPPASLVGSLRREIQALEPNLPVPNIRPVTEAISTSLYAPRMGAILLGVFGGLALLLAAVGIYGVLAFSISRRTREMGIRLALGAEARSVFLMVVRDGMLLVAIGVAIGLSGGLFGARSLASLLYGVTPFDAPTLAAMVIVLTGVALAACIIPARRAMRVNPIAALRYD